MSRKIVKNVSKTVYKHLVKLVLGEKIEDPCEIKKKIKTNLEKYKYKPFTTN